AFPMHFDLVAGELAGSLVSLPLRIEGAVRRHVAGDRPAAAAGGVLDVAFAIRRAAHAADDLVVLDVELQAQPDAPALAFGGRANAALGRGVDLPCAIKRPGGAGRPRNGESGQGDPSGDQW